nr:transposase, Ptta/En/Spm [Tanacetum cinerariifolium]
MAAIIRFVTSGCGNPDADYDNGSISRGRGISGNIGGHGSSSTSGCDNQDADFDANDNETETSQRDKEKKWHVSLLEAYLHIHTSTNVSSEALGSGMEEASEGRTREYVTASSKGDAVEAAIVEKHGPAASEHPPIDYDLWGEAT